MIPETTNFLNMISLRVCRGRSLPAVLIRRRAASNVYEVRRRHDFDTFRAVTRKDQGTGSRRTESLSPAGRGWSRQRPGEGPREIRRCSVLVYRETFTPLSLLRFARFPLPAGRGNAASRLVLPALMSATEGPCAFTPSGGLRLASVVPLPACREGRLLRNR